MTEQEIVNILKGNKTKGIAYMFLPEKVWDWIGENLNNSNLLYLDSMGNWQYFKDADFDDYDNVVFALPDMFDLPPKPQTGWVEFDITDKGLFFLEYTDRGGSNLSHRFYWHQWSQFLEYCDIDELKYTVFGGWQYKNSKGWFTTPQLEIDNGYISKNYCREAKPAIPVKIRFWRESR